MIRALLSLLAAATLASCAASPQPSATCTIDPTRILPWSQYHLVDEKPPPNVFVYEGCGKRLVYIAAQHANDPASETFKQINTALTRWQPAMLVAEGFPEAMGESPRVLVPYATKAKDTPEDNEGFAAIRLVIASGGAFIGGEPDSRAVLAGLEAQGFTLTDMFGSFVLRNIDQWKREQRLTDHRDPRLDGLIKELAAYTAPDLGIPVTNLSAIATREAFAAWYARINGLPFDTGYRAEDSHPSSPTNNRPTNALSDRLNDLRDQNIIRVIARALDTHSTVAVVYGNSHYAIAAPALEAAFGKPIFAGRLN